MLLFAAVLLSTFAASAQDKKTGKDNKWKVRARVIAAIPPSNNYDFGHQPREHFYCRGAGT